MKYVRTKDGIYEAKKNKVGAWITKLPYKIFDRDIIAKADTIEELCDAFIIIDEDKKKSVYLKELNWTFDMMQDLGMWSDRTCYGAIWIYDSSDAPTLKSVAKMNDKGELELL